MRSTVCAVLSLALAAGVAGSAGAAPAPLSVTIASVAPGPFSATVRWRTSRPATVVVEYGLTNGYGVWSRRIDSGADGGGRTALASLQPGRRYLFRVDARAGSARVTATGDLTTSPLPDWVDASATSNGLAVAGQPFFPRMVWRECPWAYQQSLAAGIDVFMGTGCGTAEEQVAALRGRGLSVLSMDDRSLAGPDVIGFHQLDEADEHVGSAGDLPLLPPARVSRRPVFLTLTNHFYSGAAPLPQGRTIYPALIARADMIGFDLYPLQGWCRRGTLDAVYGAQRELVALAQGKPTYQWIEAGDMGLCPWLDPSPALVRAETWLAIAGGARGIGWFPDAWPQPMHDAIAGLSDEIASLAPALLGDEGEADVAPAGAAVRVGVRRSNGATYVIAVNSWINPATVRIHVPGLRGPVRVYGENRVLPVRGGTIVDSFRGLRARVYVEAPAGS